MEHDMGKSFRHNLFGTISSASSSDTGRQLNFVHNGKNTNSNIGSPKDLAELKKKQKLLFDQYTRKKLEETEEELDSSNEKLAPDDMVSMLNMHKRSSSTRKRKGLTEVGGDVTPGATYNESLCSEDKEILSDLNKREQMQILAIVEGKAMLLHNMFNKRLMEKDINKMTDNLALMGCSVMRLDETQGNPFFLCVARELSLSRCQSGYLH